MNQRIDMLAKAGVTMRSLEDANDCIAQLVAEVEKHRKNSDRYEWLRKQNNDDWQFSVIMNPHFDVYPTSESLDIAIDKAMKEQP